MKIGDIVEIAVPSLESKWLHGLEVGTKVRVHQLFEDEPRRVAVEVGGTLRMVLPSELREVHTFAAQRDAVEATAKALHAHGADSLVSDIQWEHLHDSERAQFLDWAKAAIAAALPHILGEPVGYSDPEQLDELADGRCAAVQVGTYSERYLRTKPLYAPSIRPAEKIADPFKH